MQHELPLLKDLVVLLLASVPIAFLCHRLRLPVLVGFMITGIVIGPYGLRLIQDVPAVEDLAEIGVVLLLFALGLEFSLRHIIEMKRMVFLGGGLQVTTTALIVLLVVYLLGRGTRHAVFFGFLFALSSTAIVLKSYIDRAEIDTLHGRAGVGILLFQDLCIVPMMLLVPILSGKEGFSTTNIALRLGSALLALAVIVLAARIIVPRVLYHIVRLRSREVFIIFAVLVILGTSWLTAQFGLSLALGAFIAGLVLSESEYSHQIVADILPFRDVFNGIFFISIGMLLSVSFLIANLYSILGWISALLAGKSLVLFALMILLGHTVRVSAMVALGLVQVGEFSFVLAEAGVGQGLLTGGDYQKFLATSIISMIATPFLIQAAPRVGFALQSIFSPGSDLEPGPAVSPGKRFPLQGHTIVVGYGLNGRNLSKVLRSVGIPYIILELNAETVREATALDEPILFGDSTRREVLRFAGIRNARVLVLAISDPTATRHTLRLARESNPDIHVIVRTRYMSELPDLYKLGADQVIPEEFETSIEIFARVLREYGIASNIIHQEIEDIRREGYQMLRAPSLQGIEKKGIAELLTAASTETLIIEPDSPAAGKTIGALALRRKTGATVIAVIRKGQLEISPDSEFEFAADDMVVLLGSPKQIEIAIEHINRRGGADGART